MGLLMLTLEDTLGDIKGRVTRRYICEYDFQKASASPPENIGVTFFERFNRDLILRVLRKFVLILTLT